MLKSLSLIFLAALIAVLGQLLLKYGMSQVGRIDGTTVKGLGALFARVATNPWVIFGFVSYGLGALVWIVVLSRVQLSFAYPLVGISYVLVVFAAAMIFHEHVSWVRWTGVLLIVAGIALVSRTGDAHGGAIPQETAGQALAGAQK